MTDPIPLHAPETLAGWRAADARRVFLRNLRLEASIGVHRHELIARQPILVSIELEVAADRSTAPGADAHWFAPPVRPGDHAARSVVCYESVAGMVSALVDDGHIDYVETLAERIVDACLRDDRIMAVAVRIEKPNAIVAAETVGVELSRRRG